MPSGSNGSARSSRKSAPRSFLATALPTEQAGQGTDLLLYVLQDIVERKQTRERAVLIQNRRPTHTCRPHAPTRFVQNLCFASNDRSARHHVVHTHQVEPLIGLCEDSYDDVSIREDPDRLRHVMRPVLDDHKATHVKFPHAPRRIEKSLVA